jgi:NADPH-dependent 2,4-dienoyl-CoA reductase/sulfur reductase-like enzyme
MENHFFTPEMSAFFHDYYEARGVRFVYNVRPMWFTNGNGSVKVGLTDGSQIETDMVVAGVGVEPAIGLFAQSPLKVEIGLLVNEYLETNVDGVYGAGDVIRFPDHIFERLRHIEHWDNAAESGKYAMKRMLGAVTEPYDYLPYFFSDVFDLSYEFWGDQMGFNRVVYRGAVESGKFSTWWLRGDRVLAAFVMGRPDDERDAAQSWIRERAQVSADILMNESKPIGDARKG